MSRTRGSRRAEPQGAPTTDGDGGARPAERARASLELLYTISRELAAQLDLRELLQRILQLTLENVGAPNGSILVLDEAGRVIEGALAFGGRVHDHTADQLADTLARGLAGWVVEHREPALVPSTRDDPRWLQRQEEEQARDSRSAVSVPLVARDRVVGALTLVHPQAGRFAADDLALLKAIGDQAGIAVENARLFAAEQERRRFASTLQEIARVISATLDPPQVFAAVLEQLERVITFDSASIFLLEDDQLRLAAGHGFEDPEGVLGLTIPFDTTVLIGRVLSTRRPMVVDDVQRDPGWIKLAHLPGTQDIHGWIGAPLIVRERGVGVLSVDSHRTGAYGPAAVELVSAFADQAATAVANAQLFAETRSAQQRYAGLFEDSIDSILLSDLDGMITDANLRAEAFLGYARSELLGRSVLSLQVPDNPDRLPSSLSSLSAGETLSFGARAAHKQGQPLPIEVHAKRIEIDAAPFLQWILRDVSERQALDELRADLTSMIFHDLRSPLGNIISSLEVLGGTLPAEEDAARSVLSIALRSSRRLLRLVESLLDIGRLEAGQAVLHKAEGSIGALIVEAVEEVLPVAEAKGHVVQFELQSGLPPLAMDVDMVRRVVINLLENAIKYTRSEGRITALARREPGRVLVGIRDTGPGIDPRDQQRIFERFARLHRSAAAKGLGLGLAFCRLAVSAHGGELWVESEPGKGSSFYFTLPL